jgi:Mg/Co/Ni transporter MgtE
MKQLLPVLIVVIVASLAAMMLVGTVFYVRPDLLGVVPPAAPADSAALAVAAHDSSAGSHATPGLAAGEDSTHGAESHEVSPADSLMGVVTAALMRSDSLSERLRQVMENNRAVLAATDSARGAQRASMAKVLEAMDPASAARILADFPDEDVKHVVLSIKKKQAAKILAALQPDRAARIMR